MRLDDGHAFAVIPEFVPYQEGMMVKSFGQSDRDAELPVLTASLRFGLVKEGRVVIDLFDIRGRRIVRLLDDHRAAGRHTVAWTGCDQSGRGVASGVYLIMKVTTG